MDNAIHERAAPEDDTSVLRTTHAADALHILILDDNPRDAELSIQALRRAGFDFQADLADAEESFLVKMRSRRYDIILADYKIPNWNGVEAFRHLRRAGIDTPFILVTGTIGDETAVELIKEGIADYVLKDRLVRLPPAIRRALHEKRMRDEREQAAHDLRESEARVRLLLDSTAEAIFGADVDGNCTFCNASTLRLLGYSDAGELLGQRIHELIHRRNANGMPSPQYHQPSHGEFSAAKVSHEDNDTLWRKDGSSFLAESWWYPVIRDGKVAGSVVTFLDITERRRAEQLKDDFLSHVSHELRSPITAICQFVAIVSEGLAGDTNQQQHDILQVILRNGQQLQSMIDALLEVTRASAGKLIVDPQPVSVSEAISDSLNSLKDAASAKSISVFFKPSAYIPAANADPSRLRQIMGILLDNAIKFTPQKGSVKIRARIFEEDCEFLLVEVSDSGCGIDASETERIFHRLYRAPTPDQAHQQGLGLGLHIASELVTRHGGKIWVRSEPLRGSHFFFTVPIFSMASAIRPLLDLETSPGDNLALLAVEIGAPLGWSSPASRKEVAGVSRTLLRTCLRPETDVLLPSLSSTSVRELFFIVARTRGCGVDVISERIVRELHRCKQLETAHLSCTVSHSFLDLSPENSRESLDSFARTLALQIDHRISTICLNRTL